MIKLQITYSAICITLGMLSIGGAWAQSTPPQPQREFRGVWVASVANIDWPSKPGLSTTAQKAELLAILDKVEDLNLNAVMLQVRPACDAFYKSDLEPWSEYLTGAMGRAPKPFYDPLEFAVAAAHRRGLELHAWFNPFRALHHSSKSTIPASHISKKRPDLVRRYGAYLWLDPGQPAARQHSLKVIMDVVRRYDIDGVHFDDYFYPYPVKAASGGTLPFPDNSSWKKYGNGLSQSAWRRKNVDDFVRQTQTAIHAAKPWVRFGISPFGIWRPGQPKQIRGLDAYESLYADARKWFRNGWVDYLVPQLYWSIDSSGQSFPVLLEWWEEQNIKNRHLYIGLNTVKIGEPWSEQEILNQIKLTRQFHTSGQVHYSASELMKNVKLGRRLKAEFYREPALPPAFTWLDSTPPPRPKLEWVTSDTRRARWQTGPGEAPWLWVLQTRRNGKWTTQTFPKTVTQHTMSGNVPEAIALRAMDRLGNLSPPARLVIK